MVLLYCLTEKWQREKQLLDKELNLQTLEETVSQLFCDRQLFKTLVS